MPRTRPGASILPCDRDALHAAAPPFTTVQKKPISHTVGDAKARVIRMKSAPKNAHQVLANDGHDTRALQHYLGHKNIQHTVRYTEMAPDRFKDFWRD